MLMMDRMLQVEKENDRLRERVSELESRNPKLFMTPQSNYLTYSDGEDLDWYLFGRRGLIHAIEDTFETEDIDDEHLNAQMFAGPVSIRIAVNMQESSHIYVKIEPDAGIVSVKRFMDCVEQEIRQSDAQKLLSEAWFIGIRAMAVKSYFGYEIVLQVQ